MKIRCAFVMMLFFMLFICGRSAPAQESLPAPMMYEHVTVNRTHIVFSLAGNLWTVPRAGGEARQLTTHQGAERYPVFSPDGSQLAFSRLIGGQWDLFVLPAAGGEARRLTWHPRTDSALAWTPDGRKVIFNSNRTGNRMLYAIGLDEVMPTELPFWQATSASYSPDGRHIATTPTSGLMDWRVYRGGLQGRIWLTSTSDWTTEQITSGSHNEELPMWIGNRIFLVSDRDGIFNLHSFDLKTRQTKQHTTFKRYGIRAAGAGADAIAFIRDGRIYLHEAGTGQTRVVDIRVSPDASELQTRTVSAAATNDWTALNAAGDSVVMTARGDVLLFDPATGTARNLTATPGVAERNPMISPDNRFVAYFSDESGEYQLHVRSISGGQEVRKIPIEAKPSFYRELMWSPDGSRIAFTDHRLALWIADLTRGAVSRPVSRIDTSTYSHQEEWWPRWSPDGRWLTYSKHLRNRVRTVFIYDVAAGQVRQVTDGVTHAEQPCFDANGKFLYFISSPNAGTSEYGWGVLNGILARPLVSRTLHALVLSSDGPPLLLPDGMPNPAAQVQEPLSATRIDFKDLSRRVIDLTVPARDYALLVPGRPGELLVQVAEWPVLSGMGNGPSQVLYSLDLTKPLRLSKLIEGINGLEVSGDGNRLLYGRGSHWHLVPGSAAPEPGQGRLDLSKVSIEVDRRAEWQQIYREAWRVMRDWFYDPGHHGQNLQELETHYAEYLPGITRRADLNALMNRMLGHVSVSHMGVGGGDVPSVQGPPYRVGLLGADYEIVDGRYRFKRIIRSAVYNDPAGTERAPLDWPGIAVREGEFLMAVDGAPIDASRNIYSYFEGKATGAVKITLAADASGKDTRTVTVWPVRDENALRTSALIAAYRQRVADASGGRLGYIYVGDYGPSIMHFIRGLAGYSDRQGVIIDQRFNGGGITSDYLIEWLRREPLYHYTFREGDDIAVPVNPGPGVKVLITNEENFSAAETFAFMYRLGAVGPMVGKRTGGGGIGPYVYTPRFIDGGRIQMPNRAAYHPDGTSWGIENVGVSPDHDVDYKPLDVVQGRDPQLEKAIQVALDEMKKKQPVPPRRPKYPIHP